jgi:hypothetical protein
MWLTSTAKPTDWRITLYCLAPDFVAGSSELPVEWADEARRSLTRIHSFLTEEAEDLRRRKIAIEVNRTRACRSCTGSASATKQYSLATCSGTM